MLVHVHIIARGPHLREYDRAARGVAACPTAGTRGIRHQRDLQSCRRLATFLPWAGQLMMADVSDDDGSAICGYWTLSALRGYRIPTALREGLGVYILAYHVPRT